ncbi:Rrf2 family transcriptional regulator [Herbaspirillum sp. WKF16]|jgi:Rrf2 family protein|uniref:Rrf2 family transcriptional regulator n=1 Tax=Herbaspirillum sp. WKF16 TaxID=3028312 RepID=UPI0023A92F61|nr:Rrf2 family transcriptional regulator [Herbaspirillum sp. WKF16]WDZ97283.1 Rrf2 family transcriptional regulator [Herbaspirillum sp. WKF16]
MKRSDRLSIALHILLHMGQRPDAPMTSEEIAGWVGTNPVVIRRTFAGLREAGIVASTKGHGGGWSLARPMDEISLHEVQQALGERLVTLGAREESPGCLVEIAVNRALDEVMEQANRILDERLAGITLASLARDVGPRFHQWQPPPH